MCFRQGGGDHVCVCVCVCLYSRDLLPGGWPLGGGRDLPAYRDQQPPPDLRPVPGAEDLLPISTLTCRETSV